MFYIKYIGVSKMKDLKSDDNFNRKWWLNPMESEQLSEGDKRNTKRFKLWILVWGVLFFSVGKFGGTFAGGVDEMPIWFWPVLVSPVIAAIFLILALARFCRETTDELLRRITYESLSIGFAVGFFVFVCIGVAKTVVGPFALEGYLTFLGLVLGYFISYVILCRKNCYV